MATKMVVNDCGQKSTISSSFDHDKSEQGWTVSCEHILFTAEEWVVHTKTSKNFSMHVRQTSTKMKFMVYRDEDEKLSNDELSFSWSKFEMGGWGNKGAIQLKVTMAGGLLARKQRRPGKDGAKDGIVRYRPKQGWSKLAYGENGYFSWQLEDQEAEKRFSYAGRVTGDGWRGWWFLIVKENVER